MKVPAVLLIILASGGFLFAEDYSTDFEIPEKDVKEEKSLDWTGSLDSRYFAFHADKTSPFYQLQFADKEELSGYMSQYKLELYLNADYQTSDLGFHLRTYSAYYNSQDNSFDLSEMYGNVNLSLSSFIRAGKCRYNWGRY